MIYQNVNHEYKLQRVYRDESYSLLNYDNTFSQL